MSENTQEAAVKRSFVFEEKTYTMGRLVLAVIQDYAAAHQDTNLATLRAAFPDSLLAEGSLHVVEDRAQIPPSREARYFLKPDEVIAVLGATIAVCNRWHRFNIYNFLPHARALGYDITELHDGVAVKQKSTPKQAAPKATPAKAAPEQAPPQTAPADPAPKQAAPKAATAKAPAKKQADASPKIPKPKAAAAEKTPPAPQWKEPGDFPVWVQEGDVSNVVSQWAQQGAEKALGALKTVP